jgi:pimeloyl-ACP methyl ester carboxylesterase
MFNKIYVYLIMDFFSFIYYLYEYTISILPKKNIFFNYEEKDSIIKKIKSLDEYELKYIINGCIDYDKNNHIYYDKKNADIFDLSNIEIKKLITYSLLNEKNFENDTVIKDLINYIEIKCNIKFKNNNNDRYIYSKWGEKFIYFNYRPLFINIIIKIIINMFHYYMLFFKKYSFYKCEKSNISYLYKNNNKKENLLFIHGFGIGYIPYLSKLKYFNDKYNIIIFIMPNISGYYWGCVPEKDIIINSVNDFMNLKNITKYNVLAHSFGTYVGQLLLNNDNENKINKLIYLDPIIFWISCFNIAEFNKYEKYLKNKYYDSYLFDILIFFVVNMDIYVNHICFRLMQPFDFIIIEPNKKILYVLSNEDYLLNFEIMNGQYKNYKNVIFLENAIHGDVIVSYKYDGFIKEIMNFYDE